MYIASEGAQQPCVQSQEDHKKCLLQRKLGHFTLSSLPYNPAMTVHRAAIPAKHV